ncbi:uncharacterized protein LOC131671183 [Phymastichus coffea]|uniref:uncharacterized protein LOC131671183 n=1 Tax=Phymastichus coffea TaxID=108790 RepID=UPI00273BCFB9|nr:uncharacterized protein LOC131671183 [Phymastichus coffea]
MSISFDQVCSKIVSRDIESQSCGLMLIYVGYTSNEKHFHVEDYTKPLLLDIRHCNSMIDNPSPTSLEDHANYDSDDFEADEFWKYSEQRRFSELEEKLKNENLDQIKSAKLVANQAEMLCAFVNYYAHFHLPTIGIEMICQMFNSFMNVSVLPNIQYHIDKLLRSDDIKRFHAFCPICEMYLRPFNFTERIMFCDKCMKITCPLKEMT